MSSRARQYFMARYAIGWRAYKQLHFSFGVIPQLAGSFLAAYVAELSLRACASQRHYLPFTHELIFDNARYFG